MTTAPRMFVMIGKYLKPLDEVQAAYPDHARWLSDNYRIGRFLGSGRQVPPRGGLIIARATDRAEMESVLREDPFAIGGLAEYEIVEFAPGPNRSPEFEAFLTKPMAAT